jgi:hypothetical protein
MKNGWRIKIIKLNLFILFSLLLLNLSYVQIVSSALPSDTLSFCSSFRSYTLSQNTKLPHLFYRQRRNQSRDKDQMYDNALISKSHGTPHGVVID